LIKGKIRPAAQISPSGSFAPLVNLVGVRHPRPAFDRRGAPVLRRRRAEKFHQSAFAWRLRFCKFSGLSFCALREWAGL